MNFDFNNVSPVFTFLICDVKAQRTNVKKKKKKDRCLSMDFRAYL